MVFHDEKVDSAAWLLVQELFESSVRIRWGRCKTARSQSTCGYDRRPGDDHEEHHESSTGVAQYTEGRPLSMTLSMLREYERRDGAGVDLLGLGATPLALLGRRGKPAVEAPTSASGRSEDEA